MAKLGYGLFLLLHVSMVTIDAAGKEYTLKYDLTKQTLSVSLKNISILQHSQSSPMIFVGAGSLTFKEFRGNFFTSNYIEERIPLPKFSVQNTSSTGDNIEFSYGSNVSVKVKLESKDRHPLVVSFGIDSVFDNFWFRVVALPDERVYGLGEQYSYLNLRGKTYPIWTREQGGVGRNKSDIVTFFADTLAGRAGGDYHTTYFPQTTFLSSRNFYCHYGGYNYAEVNLQPPNFHEVYINGPVSSFFFQSAGNIKDLTGKLATYLGLQPKLPDWVYTGAILGVQGGTDVMLRRYRQAKLNNVPVSGLWIQDWAGVLKTSFGSRLFWDWKWNKKLYPGLNEVIKDLKANGTRVLAYINPNLNAKGELFKEASDKGYFVKNISGLPYLTDFGEFYCGTVDFTNPAARDWYKGVIQENMIDLGLSGWMADFGEYLPADGVFFYNNQSGRALHNKWPALWAEVNRMAIDERNVTGDVVFWMRAGTAGSGKYTTLMWAGDQDVDFSYGDGLPSTIPAALNLGMSGIGITHFDIGGYTTAAQFKAIGKALVRTGELLLRSAEAAIFTPMFRSHEGNQPQANVQFYSNDYIERCFGRLARIYVHISNYTKNSVRDNSLFGTPVQRPLFMVFPNDNISRTVTYQYMLGDDLLVAPVIQQNVSKMQVYLPPGDWKFIWDDQDYPGHDFHNVDSPLGKPPAFYKKNSHWAPLFSQIKSKFPLIPPPPLPPSTTPTSTSKSTSTSAGIRVKISLWSLSSAFTTCVAMCFLSLKQML